MSTSRADQRDGRTGVYDLQASAEGKVLDLHATVVVKPEARDRWFQILAAVIPPSRAEDACETFTVCELVESPNTFMILEEWKSLDGFFAHNGMPYVTAFFAALDDVLVAPPEGTLREVRTVAAFEPIEQSGAGANVGTASAELMQALVMSAAGDTRPLSDSLNASLRVRVQAYVRLHLRDPDLNPERIASDNGMSLRALYKLYESLETSLEQSILEQRLLGARTDLSSERQRFDSIASLSRAWGFSNPSFFSAKFRQANGVTPSSRRQ